MSEQETPAVEEVAAPVNEVEEWLTARKEAQFAFENPHLEQEQEPKEEAPPEVETSTEETPPAEPQSRAARRIMQKERELRTERDAWKSEQADQLAKIEAWEKASETAKLDPRSYLETLGIDKEAQLDLARIIFFEENPDMATPETTAKIEAIKRKRWERSIEEKVTAKPEEPVESAEPELNEFGIPKAHEPVLGAIQHFASEASAEEFPLVSHYMKHGDAESNEVLGAMYQVTLDYAKEQKYQGAVLSPQDAMAKVEAHLKAQRDKLLITTEQKSSPEPKEAQPVRTTIDNSVGRQPPTQAVNTDPLSDEAKARRKARFNAILDGSG